MSVDTFFYEWRRRSGKEPLPSGVLICAADIECSYHPIWSHVKVVLRVRSKNAITLERMSSYPKGERKGTQALEYICHLADKHAVSIVLHSCAGLNVSSAHGESQRRLNGWYMRHGFVTRRQHANLIGRPAWMRRKPTNQQMNTTAI